MGDLTNFKLLVVGAGGIGCELLKNLVLTGFTQIEVIDLDTIELSNLNRQFLFQKVHVGKPKAIIARESVLKYNPNANIIAYHDSIMNVKYNVDYFKQFNMVLNALDNKAARSHVNRLCLAADVPLIESGSGGYLGQVTLIKKNLTECYDCLPKPPAKTFPGCTIRNTPSEPIHCIVWAKHLFNQLFGSEDPDEAVSPDGEDPENMADAGNTAVAKSSTEEIVTRVSTRQWAKETSYDPTKIFNKLFKDDIKYLLSMAKLWEKRRAPEPLDWSESTENQKCYEDERQNESTSSKTNQTNSSKLASQKIWTISECCDTFTQSVKSLQKRLEESTDSDPMLCWDKDEEDHLNFVASAASLRCYVFAIPVRSKFEIKSLAGNIIPAIATTNAIVAGLIVLQALKVLNNKLNECKTVYLRDHRGNNTASTQQSKIIVGCQLVKPNEKCYVCAEKPEISVRLNLNTFTVKNFETKILKQELNMVQPDVEIDDGTGRIIISSEEGETDENNDKFLSFFGLTDKTSLKCDDFFQNYQLKVTLYQCDKFEAENTKEYELINDNQLLKDVQEKLKNQQQQQPTTSAAVEDVELKDDKKRRYEAAFDSDYCVSLEKSASGSSKPKSIKKLKSSNSLNQDGAIEDEELVSADQPATNELDDSSNSINDASDALSDEDISNNGSKQEACVQSKQANSTSQSNSVSKNKRFSVIEEITVDDDCIIEENSNDVKLANGDFSSENSNSGSGTNNMNEQDDSDKDDDDDDSDVIECTESDDDVIECNTDSMSSKPTDTNSLENNLSNGIEKNGNGNGHYQNNSKSKEIHLNGNNNGSSDSHEHKNGNCVSSDLINSSKKKSTEQETDDSVTVIE